MARKRRAAAGEGSNEQDVNLTPMLDVVFILLIFFIVTAQFIKEPGVDILRQEVDNASNVKPLAILIALSADDEIYIDRKRVEENEVEFRIKDLREDNPRGELVLQADNNSSAEALVGLLETIKKAEGNSAVNISTAQE